MHCLVHGCQNKSERVRGHRLISRNEEGIELHGWICNPCWHFLLDGTNHMSTLARNGRKRLQSKGVKP